MVNMKNYKKLYEDYKSKSQIAIIMILILFAFLLLISCFGFYHLGQLNIIKNTYSDYDIINSNCVNSCTYGFTRGNSKIISIDGFSRKDCENFCAVN